MAMSRQHYEKMAAVLAAEIAVNAHNEEAQRAVRNVAMSLADLFAQDNPRFNRAFFYAKAGVEL